MLKEERADRKTREKEIKAKTKATEKRKKKVQERKKAATSDEESYVPRATKSRRKRTDESSVSATESEADSMSIVSDVSRRSTRTTGRNYTKQITCGSTLANASDMEIGSNTDRSESVEVLEEPKARNRRRRAPSYESVAISSEEEVGKVPSVNALQTVDEDPTPRPRRIVESSARCLPSRQPSSSVLSSTNNFLPLQVARAKAISTYDAHWQKSFRAPVSDDGHSSESSEARTTHQYAWLLSDEGSSSRSSSP
ncbi:hypothetical protein SERLA73DRAFT_187424 [Serpula lacrymans var. lacrymans S7.3]|uniref:Uncharacterized protein n=3 Tax=Serpula lacrymans var. lacrymans TaxID=341189 RepID=F8Q957_SERL3|nr:hypothetical protein SERLA73DRAFT_187424 [Serpula lacrymans var. lacrymans S7.3]